MNLSNNFHTDICPLNLLATFCTCTCAHKYLARAQQAVKCTVCIIHIYICIGTE